MRLFHLLRNVSSNYALVVVNGLAGLVLTPALLHYLHPVNFSILAFALAIAGILEGLDLGMAGALIRFVSNLVTRGLYLDLKRLVSTVFYLLLGIGLFGSAILVILSPPLANFFHVRGDVSSPGWLALALVGAGVVFHLPTAALRGHLEGCQNFHLANAVDIVTVILRAALTLIFLHSGLGLIAVAALFPAFGFLRLAGMLATARQAAPSFHPSLANMDLKNLREIWQFASIAFVEDSVGRLASQADTFLAARLLPLPELAILVVARRIPMMLAKFAQQTLVVAYPLVSAAAARGDRQAMQRFMLVSTRTLLAFTIPLAAGLYVWGADILRLWVGPEVLSGVPVFRWFLVLAVFGSLFGGPLTLLYGLGKIQFSAGLSLGMLMADIGWGAWACSRGGILGLAIVFAAIQSAGTLLLFWQTFELTELEPGRWFKKAVAPVLLAVSPAIVWIFISRRIFPHTLVGLIASGTVGLIIFLGLFARLVTGHESQTWRGRVRRLLIEIE